MDGINSVLNDVHLKVMEINSQAGQIQVTCQTTLSSHGHLQKFNALEKQYKKITEDNFNMKKKLFEQGIEY